MGGGAGRKQCQARDLCLADQGNDNKRHSPRSQPVGFPLKTITQPMQTKHSLVAPSLDTTTGRGRSDNRCRRAKKKKKKKQSKEKREG